eukprot:363563-Prorocentrum_minimum.AAC.2
MPRRKTVLQGGLPVLPAPVVWPRAGRLPVGADAGDPPGKPFEPTLGGQWVSSRRAVDSSRFVELLDELSPDEGIIDTRCISRKLGTVQGPRFIKPPPAYLSRKYAIVSVTNTTISFIIYSIFMSEE